MVTSAQRVAAILNEKGCTVTVVNVRFVKPFDMDMLNEIQQTALHIVTLEENAVKGGMGQMIAGHLLDGGYTGGFKALGIPDEFVSHGGRDDLLRDIGLDDDSIVDTVLSLISKPGKSSNGLLRKLGLRKTGEAKKKTGDPNADLFAPHKNR